jgi:drug/metabolite transporter (DMT)-like permease
MGQRTHDPAAAAGLLLVAGGAMLFALKGVVAKFIYARGMDYESLVVIRSVAALPFFWAWALHHGAASAVWRAPREAVAAAAAAGALCYGLGSLLDFHALTLIDASLERALLFTYPAMVVLATAALRRRRPGNGVMAAIALTWAGVALAVGAFDGHVLEANARGSAYVLLCAATFATYFLASERYTRLVGSLAFTAFAMTGAAAGLLAFYLPRHAALPTVPDATSGWLMLVLVLFSTVAPALMLAEGIRRVGAERGAIVSTVGPPFTIVVAWLLLDERLTAVQLLGTGLIVVGIFAVERARRREAGP